MSFAQTLVGHTSLRNGLLWLVETRHPKSRIYDSLQNHAYGIESAGGGVATNNTYTTSFPRGPATRFNAAGDGSYTIEGRKPTLENATIACWVKCANATPTDNTKTGFPIDYSYQSGASIASHYPWSDGTIYCNTLRSNRRTITPSSSVSRTDWHLVTVATSPSGWRFYQNGYLIDSTTSTAIGTLQTAFFAKSRDPLYNVSFYFHGDIAWWGFWTISLTTANVLELLRLSRGNQVAFQFPYYLVGEAATGAIQGSTSLTFSTTGNTTATGVLAGSSTLTFSTTGATVGVGAVAGASALTFSTTGNAQLTGSLSGTSDLSFTDTGSLLGSGVLAASSTLTFSDTGSLLGSGVLAASSTLTFSDTGDLLGTGALTGPTTLDFTTTGALFSGTELYGSTTLTFSDTGALVGVGSISGSSTLTFTDSGNVTGVGVLNASTTVDFSTSGLISGVAACVANTTLDFSTSGLLGGTGTLLGNSSVSFSLTGDLALGLVGSTSLAFTLTGNVVGIGAISGTSNLTFGVSGGFSVDETGILMDASPNIFWFGTIV